MKKGTFSNKQKKKRNKSYFHPSNRDLQITKRTCVVYHSLDFLETIRKHMFTLARHQDVPMCFSWKNSRTLNSNPMSAAFTCNQKEAYLHNNCMFVSNIGTKLQQLFTSSIYKVDELRLLSCMNRRGGNILQPAGQ